MKHHSLEIGKDSSGSNIACWFNNVTRQDYPLLSNDLRAEICIVGAGIAGLTTAYKLVSEGKSKE